MVVEDELTPDDVNEVPVVSLLDVAILVAEEATMVTTVSTENQPLPP